MAYTARKGADLKEFFDEPSVLQTKIKKLASLIRKSKHLVVYTGAGISTACGIADYRSGLSTVLDTGAGKWAKEAAIAEGKMTSKIKQDLKEKKKKNKGRVKAVPSKSHMALIALAKAGYLKHLISQNTDGLHRRSGFPIDQLSELHGNGTLEICQRCNKTYMRDNKCRNKKNLPNKFTAKLEYLINQIQTDLASQHYHKLSTTNTDKIQKRLAQSNEFLQTSRQDLKKTPSIKKPALYNKIKNERLNLATAWQQILATAGYTLPRYFHYTGRSCSVKGCDGKLADTIINFGECLPVETRARAEKESSDADLYLVLGSSCTVTPAADMPEEVGLKWEKELETCKNGKDTVHNLCIVNLQKTPLHDLCSLPIHCKIDEVMVGVMRELGLEIPSWSLTRYLKLQLRDGDYDDLRVIVSACDCDGTPATMFKNVWLRQDGKRLLRMIDNKNGKQDEYDFVMKEWNNDLKLEMRFCGNYEEPNLVIELNDYLDDSFVGGCVVLKMMMNPSTKEWIVPDKKEQAKDVVVRSLMTMRTMRKMMGVDAKQNGNDDDDDEEKKENE